MTVGCFIVRALRFELKKALIEHPYDLRGSRRLLLNSIDEKLSLSLTMNILLTFRTLQFFFLKLTLIINSDFLVTIQSESSELRDAKRLETNSPVP